jgi:hypothetical protein
MTNLSRIPWLGVAALLTVAAGSRVQQPDETTSPQTSTASSPPGSISQADSFLAAVRGTTPLACEMIVRSVGLGWGWGSWSSVPDSEKSLADQVRWATQRREDPSIVPTLRTGLDDPDACVRRASARLLGSTRHPDAIEALLDALGSSDVMTRQLAAVGLGYADDRETVEPLLRLLRDDSASVRAAAAWALGRIEDRRAVEPLTRLLSGDSDAGVRRAAAVALGDILG